MAASFLTQDAELRREARAYHMSVLKVHAAPDPLLVKSFTGRRSQLALSAFAQLQAQLRGSGYAALQRYLDSDFRKSITVVER